MSLEAQSGWPQPEFDGLIDEFDLDDREKRFMRARWLDQIAWFERKAKQAQQYYYALRLTAIVGGLVVPALVSLNVRHAEVAPAIAWSTFVLSLSVGIAVAVDGFFNYGARWRQYRRTAEHLKAHGWQFFELAGAYNGFPDHHAGFASFASAVEALIADDVDVYLSKVMREQQQDVRPAGGHTGGI